MILVIDTVDVSALAPEAGYEVSYNSIDGGQGNYMLDGTTSVDELNVKAVVRVPLYPLTKEQIRNILELVMVSPIHSVMYEDPWLGIRTVKMKRSVTNQKYRGKAAGGDYWTGTVLEFTEK